MEVVEVLDVVCRVFHVREYAIFSQSTQRNIRDARVAYTGLASECHLNEQEAMGYIHRNEPSFRKLLENWDFLRKTQRDKLNECRALLNLPPDEEEIIKPRWQRIDERFESIYEGLTAKPKCYPFYRYTKSEMLRMIRACKEALEWAIPE